MRECSEVAEAVEAFEGSRSTSEMLDAFRYQLSAAFQQTILPR